MSNQNRIILAMRNSEIFFFGKNLTPFFAFFVKLSNFYFTNKYPDLFIFPHFKI